MTCQRPKTLTPCAILGGNIVLVERLMSALTQFGFQADPATHLAIILDIPRGYALQQLEEHQQQHVYLVITGNTCSAYLADLWEQGISGLVIKSGFDEEIVVALDTIAQGGTYRNCDIATNLTVAERVVLRYIASGWSDQAIAEALHLSKGTVMNRVSEILSKIGCANRTQAALWYWGMQPIFIVEDDVK